ncbi:hypothetical protein D3C83_208150 [compost metagenome]
MWWPTGGAWSKSSLNSMRESEAAVTGSSTLQVAAAGRLSISESRPNTSPARNSRSCLNPVSSSTRESITAPSMIT